MCTTKKYTFCEPINAMKISQKIVYKISSITNRLKKKHFLRKNSMKKNYLKFFIMSSVKNLIDKKSDFLRTDLVHGNRENLIREEKCKDYRIYNYYGEGKVVKKRHIFIKPKIMSHKNMNLDSTSK